MPSHCAGSGRFLFVEVRSSGESSLVRSPGRCVALALLREKTVTGRTHAQIGHVGTYFTRQNLVTHSYAL